MSRMLCGGDSTTWRNADFQSAVSPIYNRPGSKAAVIQVHSVPAEYNSAIQQIENLRYVNELALVGN
jgi:hypothetical protein